MTEPDICPYCYKQHEDEPLQMLCPMRPERLPFSIRDFGELASDSEYSVTDRVRYIAEDGEKQKSGLIG
jgi:hypothetical protein